ncbi:MAG: hypothetical protein FWG84_05095 [Bacteroidales bacterium]|nr:hypothetical protein [Bacteroidales bacterium]
MTKNKEIRAVYPVRDNMLVERKISQKSGIPLGMQPAKHDIAYLRHAMVGWLRFSTNITSLRDEIRTNS